MVWLSVAVWTRHQRWDVTTKLWESYFD